MREKRRFIRFNAALEVFYIVQKEPRAEKTGITEDVSAHGIQLITSDKLKTGDKVSLSILIPGAPNPAHIKGVIVWTKERSPVKNDAYSAGIDFEKIEEDNKNTFLKFLCNLMYVKSEDKKENENK